MLAAGLQGLEGDVGDLVRLLPQTLQLLPHLRTNNGACWIHSTKNREEIRQIYGIASSRLVSSQTSPGVFVSKKRGTKKRGEVKFYYDMCATILCSLNLSIFIYVSIKRGKKCCFTFQCSSFLNFYLFVKFGAWKFDPLVAFWCFPLFCFFVRAVRVETFNYLGTSASCPRPVLNSRSF